MTRLSETATLRKIIGILIRAARGQNGVSLKACATVIGQTPNALRRIEAGEDDISIPNLQILAQFLKIPIEHFFNNQVTLTEGGDSPPHLSQHADQQARVGTRLRKARRSAGLNQTDLAALLGCSTRIISQYEQGKRPLAASHVARLIEVLDLRLHQLLPDRMYEFQQVLEEMPEEVRQFFLNLDNLPYLQVAMQLRQIATADMRKLITALARTVEAAPPVDGETDHGP